MRPNGLSRLILAFGLVAGASLGAAVAEERAVPASQAQVKLSFAPVAKVAGPAVVNVYSSKTIKVASSPLMDDPFFRQFFGGDMPGIGRQRERHQQSLGSGVIVDPSGLIVTNNHVIEDGDEVKVALADRRELDCDVVLKDEQLDLAVLKVRNPKEALPTLPLADSDQLQVGDLVLAIGNPFGVGQTVTQGIVSALARSQVGISDYQFFIQTDAAINPGNSGGALVDMDGKLVGINTAIFSRGGGSNGIGFAIPSNMVKVFVDSARRGGSAVELPWIGAELQPVTNDIAESLGLDRPSGVLITSILRKSPAEAAGLDAGDLVVAVDGIEVSDPRVFNYRLATKGVGNVARLTVNRAGKLIEVPVKLTAAPETTPREALTIDTRSPFMGATVANMSPAVAAEIGLTYRGQTGVVITAVAPGSPADRIGLQKGDIILSVNGNDITATKVLAAAAGADPLFWRVAIDRNGQILRMAFR
ncbi:serine protease [Pleomorphomonas diazotrophica]|uniref:Serine protease n=1 Tax=Pleomorphomonas diazotrophica TaxID=1166257 RepID=A0A1I4U5S8_9HYPH|nr:DegQ family serine endoprotease [Pleomorphomonas diazotrophica]PKR91168.1 serine protease [Pleomorphomonas diazotrophica]SFM84255.1 Do/DeqQ family serine protease [Pleomorphomonas diazotrophica]